MTHVPPVAGSVAQYWFIADSLYQEDTQTDEAILPRAIPPEKAHIKWPVTSVPTLDVLTHLGLPLRAIHCLNLWDSVTLKVQPYHN